MRHTRDIAALSETAQSVTFPRFNREFDKFRRTLFGLVCKNFGLDSDARESFDWDEHNGRFTWAVSKYCGSLDKTRVDVRHTFEIDPAKPLPEEFARVADEYAAFDKHSADVRRALGGIGAKMPWE